MAHVHGQPDDEQEHLDEILGRGDGDPDVHGYPGQTLSGVTPIEPTTAPLLPENLVAELLRELGDVKQKANTLYAEYKGLKAIEDEMKQELFAALNDSGLKSIKGKDYTASITEKPTVVIKDEAALIEWLQHEPDIEADFYIGVKKDAFGTLANQMLKESGELANGTDVVMRESLAIRSNPKKKEIKR